MASAALHQQIPIPAAVAVPAGEHLWVLVAAWEIDPSTLAPGEQLKLDSENLLALDGPGCFLCEHKYNPLIAALPCPGVRDA